MAVCLVVCPVYIHRSTAIAPMQQLTCPHIRALSFAYCCTTIHRSTIAQTCNYSGWFDPSLAAEFGVVSIDWANHENSYRSRPFSSIPGGPVYPDDADLVTQAEMIKLASRNQTKVGAISVCVQPLCPTNTAVPMRLCCSPNGWRGVRGAGIGLGVCLSTRARDRDQLWNAGSPGSQRSTIRWLLAQDCKQHASSRQHQSNRRATVRQPRTRS